MRTILLTGASGVVGRAIAGELRDEHIIGLVHTDADLPEVDEIQTGDLGRPLLDLGEARWRELAERTDVIVHSAALTQWGLPYAHYQQLNVNGTERIVEFARAADAPIHLISTAFVHALERGNRDVLGPTNVVTPYITSKLESERLLAESGVAHKIYRPTNLVGDSRTGASYRPQIVQAMSDWICRGKAPYFPLHPGNRVDVVPLDMLSVAVAHSVEADDLDGAVHWVTYGPNAMTAEIALDVLVEFARTLGREIPSVPVIDPRQQLPIPIERIPATSRSFLKVLIDVSEVTYGCGGILPSSPEVLDERFDVTAASGVEAYRRSLEYWAAERTGARELT
jgi:nucleoside-diphosphate-sugar epimerase